MYQYAEVIIQDTIGEHLLEGCKAARTEVIAEETRKKPDFALEKNSRILKLHVQFQYILISES